MISIIVPVYNSEHSIERCVNSICGQSYRDLEILLVDDGSTDRSAELLDGLAENDSRIWVIHKENGGVSSARNRGLEESRGSYVQFVDSDDYLDQDMCKDMAAAMEEQQADLVVSGFHHWFLGKDIVKTPSVAGSWEVRGFAERFGELYRHGFFNMPWNKLFKKEYILEQFDESLSLGEDLLFNMDYLAQIRRIAVIKDSRYHYIQDDSKETLSNVKREDKLDIAMHLYEQTREKHRIIFGNSVNDQDIAARFMAEFCDELAGMAFDTSQNSDDKRSRIAGYISNPRMSAISREAAMVLTDHKIMNWLFKRKQKWLLYCYIQFRGFLVELLKGKRRNR